MRRGLSLFLVLLSALCLGPGPGEARAQAAGPGPEAAHASRAEALDSLFGALAASRRQGEAAALRDRIWSLWLHSGSPSVDLLMSRSVAAMEEGQWHQALEILDRLVVLAPEFAEAWNKRATVLYHLGERERSLADIARTLALEPRHFGALSGLAMILEEQGSPARAAVARARIRALTPLLR